jgi:hypothetical protein
MGPADGTHFSSGLLPMEYENLETTKLLSTVYAKRRIYPSIPPVRIYSGIGGHKTRISLAIKDNNRDGGIAPW